MPRTKAAAIKDIVKPGLPRGRKKGTPVKTATKVINFHPVRKKYHPKNYGYSPVPKHWPKNLAQARINETMKKLAEMKRLGFIDPEAKLEDFGLDPSLLSSATANPLLALDGASDGTKMLEALFSRKSDGVLTDSERRESEAATQKALKEALFDVLIKEAKEKKRKKDDRTFGREGSNVVDPKKPPPGVRPPNGSGIFTPLEAGGWAFNKVSTPRLYKHLIPGAPLVTPIMTTGDYVNRKHILDQARKDEFKQFHFARRGVLPPNEMVERAFPKNVAPLNEEDTILFD